MNEPDSNAGAAKYSAGTQAMVAIAVIGLLLAGCVLVLLPFSTAILWAIILCFSTWPIFTRLKRAMGGRSSLAALTMTLLLAGIVVAPFVIVGSSLADNVTAVSDAIRHFFGSGPLTPPQWINDVPVVGPHVQDYLTHLANDKTAQKALLHDLITPLKVFALELGKALGYGIMEISLSLVVCFFLYRDGDVAVARLESAAYRVGADRGQRLLEVARLTVTGVVHGILGTSLIQGIAGGIGFWIAGVPGAVLLGFATFVLSFVPMGPLLLWGPAAVWLYYQGATGWAIFLVVWSLIANTIIDNVLKPIIIARTGGTPFLIVLFGALGGAIIFGLIGIFIGPVLLAVGYGIIEEWSEDLVARPRDSRPTMVL